MNIIMHSDDINLLSYWQSVLKNNTRSVDTLEDLSEVSSSVVIVNLSALEGSYKKILKTLKSKNNKVLVLHRNPNIVKGKELFNLGVVGYGNALMKEHFLHSAVDTIKDGLIWLHPELISSLIVQIPTSQSNNTQSQLQTLTQKQKDVALLLRDGCRYKEIALKLDITDRAVKSHAQNIYKKLGVSDRLALALLLK